ncbi:hypothetical protein C2G38_286493 [Gigaspora rosea]|uniref:RBR-type E3 ubiquitin transferase n=1 Tax=Gigaspora rosea TaxID=44941 RepID=A0A397VYA1_9GLOM|nr:hypothetical protein C2G38_286493 [Gigaspora rosea]
MSDNIFIKYIKIINERNRTIDLRGQVLIQNSCNKEKTVTIEYTTDSWDTDNRVTATWSRKLSPNKDLYDFEILSVKSSKLPLYFEFTVLCDIAGSILWISDGFNYSYDKDTPKEFFFDYADDDDDNSNYSMDEERKKLDELRKQLEEERKKLDEYNNEGRKKLKEERNQLDEERNQLEEIRKQLEEERRQLEKQMMEINNHEDNTNSSPSQLSNSIFVKYIKVVNEYNGVIDLQGQVVVQTIGSDKSVIIEYTTDSWITNNQVNATWSHTLSSEQDSYYFKISVSKSSNLPLYLEFTALCNVAGTVLWTNSYEYLYDVGTPKELFFNDTFTESYIDSFFPLNISKDEKKECSICAENVDIKAFLNVTDLCNHDSNICRECIGEYIKHELEDKGNINISCPLDDCHEILRERDVKEFATEDVFTRYERLMINFALSQIPTFQWCLNTSCESGQDHYQGENVPIMTCNACGQKSCVVHGIPISDGCERCLQQQEERRKQEEQRQQEEEDRKRRENEESASERYVTKLKQCPKCLSRIEKNSGCDHMKCRRPGCGYEFCWICMVDFNEIRSKGNRVHKVNCKYYA